MAKKDPLDRLEEILLPAQEQKKEFSQEKQELANLLKKLPDKIPSPQSPEHPSYLMLKKEILELKERIAKKHKEWMEMVKTEEKVCREINEN